MEDGRVAVADDELFRDAAQVGGEAQKPVSAASEDHGLGVASKRAVQLGLAACIVAREVGGAREDVLGETRDEADLAQREDAALEALAIERARGRDDVDRIARKERFHRRSVLP